MLCVCLSVSVCLCLCGKGCMYVGLSVFMWEGVYVCRSLLIHINCIYMYACACVCCVYSYPSILTRARACFFKGCTTRMR